MDAIRETSTEHLIELLQPSEIKTEVLDLPYEEENFEAQEESNEEEELDFQTVIVKEEYDSDVPSDRSEYSHVAEEEFFFMKAEETEASDNDTVPTEDIQGSRNKRARRMKTSYCKCCENSFPVRSARKKRPTKQRSPVKKKELVISGKICRSKNVPSSYLGRTVISHVQDKFNTCSICLMTFVEQTSLKLHMLCHNEHKRVFSCNHCEKSYFCEQNLKRHLKTHNNSNPRFACEICGRKFRERNHLKEHSIVHSLDRPFSCSVCNSTYRQKGGLTAHMRTHTGDTPYTCTHCSISFSSRNAFRKHKDLCKIIHLKDPVKKSSDFEYFRRT